MCRVLLQSSSAVLSLCRAHSACLLKADVKCDAVGSGEAALVDVPKKVAGAVSACAKP